MAIERTFSIIKPNAVAKNVIGSIFARFESAGFKIVGTKMLHTVMAYTKQNGFEKLTLAVNEANERNMHLYGKAGFRTKIKTIDTDLLFFTPNGDPIKTQTLGVYCCEL